MPLKLCSLASGSNANCTFVGSEETGILVDAGLSARETAARLTSLGIGMERISAICLTHEHSDHISGLQALRRKHGMAIYANSSTVEAMAPELQALGWNVFATGTAFSVGDLRVESFSVPHDAFDPVGFIFQSGSVRAGIVTDLGTVTGLVRERLRSCNVLVLEANHDEKMLKDARRPWPLKQRIAGRHGHLSNAGAGELLAQIAGPHLSDVFLAHLSGECNTQECALETVCACLKENGFGHVRVRLTYRDRVGELWSEGD